MNVEYDSGVVQEYRHASQNVFSATLQAVQTVFIVVALFAMLALEWCGLLKDPVTNPVNELLSPRFRRPWRKNTKGMRT